MQQHVPEWPGYMRLITRNNTSGGRYTIEFLPFIELDPSHESTICNLNVCNKSMSKIWSKPILTFDQPLWFKSMNIKMFKNLDITILLGNFHTQMSFLCGIGYVMKNSGIK